MEDKELICGEKCPHYQTICEVKLDLPSENEVEDLATIFKIFSDTTRLRIICAIIEKELCVCDLCELLNLTQSNVSHQLQILRTNKLVKYRKEGKQVYYTVKDDHVKKVISIALEHIRE